MKKCVLISKITGKRIVFNSITEAGAFLGYDYHYMCKMRKNKKPIKSKSTGEVFDVLSGIGENGLTLKDIGVDMIAYGVPTNAQPCGYCKKACGGCSWSRNFKPVDGWKAIPTLLDKGNGNKPIESYKILFCPEFVRG